jgi:hypothetical protein
MTAPLKLGPQLFEIIDLTVQNDPDPFFGIGHRLVSASEIYDGKPSEAQSKRTRQKVTLVVRTAMDHSLGHSADRFRFYRLVSGEIKLTANAAHGLKKG